MIELRFDPELYSGKAIDFAVKTFESFAKIETSQEADAFIVRVAVEPGADHDEGTIADELSNFALGTTIEQGEDA